MREPSFILKHAQQGFFFVWTPGIFVLFHILYMENWGTERLSTLSEIAQLSLMLSLIQQQRRCMGLRAPLSQSYSESSCPHPVSPQDDLPGQFPWLKDLISVHLNMRNNTLNLKTLSLIQTDPRNTKWDVKVLMNSLKTEHWSRETQRHFTLFACLQTLELTACTSFWLPLPSILNPQRLYFVEEKLQSQIHRVGAGGAEGREVGGWWGDDLGVTSPGEQSGITQWKISYVWVSHSALLHAETTL